MKKLCELIKCNYDVLIKDINTDSRMVKKGSLFVATCGYNVDHYDFINKAVDNGAVAVVADKFIDIDVPLVIVENIDDELVSICKKFYDVSIDDFNFIGITGTDGKTTTSSIVKQILNPSNKTAYIGTNGVEFDGHNFSTNNTTPCIEELYRNFEKIKNNECKTISMEVSSEALLHKRVDSLKFDIVGFTNITEDHLNIHKTVDNYIDCKKHLIDLLKDDGVLIFNGDDINCKELKYNNMYTYGFNNDNDFVILNVNNRKEYASFDISFNGFIYKIKSPLTGNYNVYNVTLAFAICLMYKLDYITIIDRISKLNFVPGRREFLNYGQEFDIVLDYAHTYNGIKNLISSFTQYNHIILVTGAAGGREKEKRKLIGKYILENVDFAIFTMDDPRFENPTDIINDMLFTTNLNNYKIIIDRKNAIKCSFDLAKKGDLVLIIGKGRDNYMAIHDKKIKYSDYETIKKYFK